MTKKLKNFLVSLLALTFLSGCASTVPDSVVCVELDINLGGCVHIVSGQQFFVDDKHPYNGKNWWDQRNEMILVPATSWVEIKKFIIDICKSTNQCQSSVTNWERSVNTIDDQLRSKD